MKRTPLLRKTPLNRGSSQLKRSKLRPRALKPKGLKTIIRSAKHLAFVRDHACVNCWTRHSVEAHHHGKLAGGGGVALKACDSRCVPLCTRCHFEFHLTGTLAPRPAEETYAWLDGCASEMAAKSRAAGILPQEASR